MKVLFTNHSLRKELIGILLLGLFLTCFLNMDKLKSEPLLEQIPNSLVHVNTVFLSILIEAFPFILLGVFVSALIQTFVTEEMVQRLIPRNPLTGVVAAAFSGLIFPICECAIIPVVRRLIKKGMPLHIGAVMLAAIPILNPVVFLSTFYAFRTNMDIVYARMGLAFAAAILLGLSVYLIFRNSSSQLKWTKEELVGPGIVKPLQNKLNRWKQTFFHASDEFFDTGKYLIGGAFIASLFQVLMDRKDLLSVATDDFRSTSVMMALAYVLSICSEADAFIAASFGTTFTAGSIVAFLVYGPMLDVKNTIMLLAYFKPRFIVSYMVIVTMLVLAGSMLLNQTVLNG
ncbi:permease [Fictibacillus iocasae]|uniref:Permease n=1 Tax=Fictibacillus iocasae TaxID=2715437 RepID=A0ABW2NQI7_9BACL